MQTQGWTVVAVVALVSVAQTTAMALLSGESASARGEENSRCHMGKGGSDCLVKRETGVEELPISATMDEAEVSNKAERVKQDVSSVSNRKKRESEDVISVKANHDDNASPIEKSVSRQEEVKSALNSFNIEESARLKTINTKIYLASSMEEAMQEKPFFEKMMAKEKDDSRCHMGIGNDCLAEEETPILAKMDEADMSTLANRIKEEISSTLNRAKRIAQNGLAEADREENASPIFRKESALAKVNNGGGGGGGGHQPPTERSRTTRDDGELQQRSSLTGEENTSTLAKNMKRAESTSINRMSIEGCVEDQPSAETRGLLGGLLGGSGGNCTAQGDTVSKHYIIRCTIIITLLLFKNTLGPI